MTTIQNKITSEDYHATIAATKPSTKTGTDTLEPNSYTDRTNVQAATIVKGKRPR